jgi:MarR family transcriptional regulator, 2-MHQ and catechol-resistance regulon repressor
VQVNSRYDLRVTSPIDDERLTAVGLFFEAHAGLSALFERTLAESWQLPEQWFEILLRLRRSPGGELRMSDLAAQVALSPSGLTRAVDRLEGAGLVCRASCPSDRRGAYAVITDQGRDVLEAALPRHLADIEEHFTGLLSAEELSAFTGALRKLRDHLNPAAAQGTERSTQ